MKRSLVLTTLMVVLAGAGAAVLHQARNIDQIPDDKFYRDKVAWYQANPASGRVVILGDSIVWRGKWDQELPECDMVMRGVEWETTAGLLARIDEITRVGADTAVVMVGTNDLAYSQDDHAIFERYRQVINRLDRTANVIVVSTTLRDAEQNDANARIKKLNSALERECSSGSCTFMDLNAEIAPTGYLLPEYTTDGIHLTPAAYERWRDILVGSIDC
ncbi:GDSL-type esterase/lipase family protein [Erythrobacter aurantius]|uniref:GDSL-type esterase/lipase family protein n=1 Tax=Erythrobacter aurantius TaxID=2909249 RepID=UPI0020795DB6|nr:GDSL-type esterase/lipase family protein [Erythrobacter aurantius]